MFTFPCHRPKGGQHVVSTFDCSQILLLLLTLGGCMPSGDLEATGKATGFTHNPAGYTMLANLLWETA